MLLVVVSKTRRTSMQRSNLLDPTLICAIYNGVEPKRYSLPLPFQLRMQLGIAYQTKVIGTVGNISSPKRCPLFIAVTARLKQLGLSIFVPIAGNYQTAFMGRLGRKIALHIIKHMQPYRFIEATTNFFNQRNFIIHPTKSRGLSIAIDETLTYRRIVVEGFK